LSLAPSLDEKINFLIQNRYQEEKELKPTPLPIQIEDIPQPVVSNPPIQPSPLAPCTAASPNNPKLPLLSSPVTSTRQPLCVKREDIQESLIMDKLRKKICRMIFMILKDEYSIPSSDAKEVTLNLEERVNMLYPSYSSAKHYIGAIKTLFKKVRSNEITLKTLLSLSYQPIDKFSKLFN
jgi:hypothetical protein